MILFTAKTIMAAMKYTPKQILGITAGAVLLTLGVYKIVTYKEPVFNKVTIDYGNTVVNQTKVPYMDTIVQVGLGTMKISDVAVVIKPMDQNVKSAFEDGTSLQAFIKVSNWIYNIYVDDIPKNNVITVIAHELVHLQQYQTNKLYIKDDTVFWNGRPFNVVGTPYENRPWEIEAFVGQGKVVKDIESILYY